MVSDGVKAGLCLKTMSLHYRRDSQVSFQFMSSFSVFFSNKNLANDSM